MVSGKDWCCEQSHGVAVELCLVWERFVAFRSVMGWSASRGLLCRGHVSRGKEWIGSQGVKRCVVSGLVESGYGSRGEAQYVSVNRGMAGYVKAVMFGFGRFGLC